MQQSCRLRSLKLKFIEQILRNKHMVLQSKIGLLFCLSFLLTGILSFEMTAQTTTIELEDDIHLMDRFEIKSGRLAKEYQRSVRKLNAKNAIAFIEDYSSDEKTVFSSLDRQLSYHLFRNYNEFSETGISNSKRNLFQLFYLLKTDFYRVQESNFLLRVNPVIHFSMAKEQDNEGLLFQNTRGAQIKGIIGNKISFQSYLSDNQARFSKVLRDLTLEQRAIPGAGRYGVYRETGFDYFSARGFIDFQLIPEIGLRFGHDKTFIGSGYRSLILSDYAGESLFLQLTTRVWKFEYTNLFKELVVQFPTIADNLLERKYLALHRLGIRLGKKWEVGIFESVVSGGESRGFDLQYLNPVIFYRAVEHGIGSPDNVMIGADFRAILASKFSIYGQFVLDEFSFEGLKANNGDWRNKFGFQLGGLMIDLAGIENLDLRLEYNQVRPYTYSHYSEYANYSHYNQSLAHPLGANFREAVAILKYRPKYKWLITLNNTYSEYGTDADGLNWGGDILLDYNTFVQATGNSIGQGVKSTVLQNQLYVSYMLRHELWIDFMLHNYQRNSDDAALDHSSITVGVGVRLNANKLDRLFK